VSGIPERRRIAAALLAALALVAGVAGIVVGASRDGGDDGSGGPVPEPGRGGPREQVSFLARIVPPPAESDAPAGPEVPRSVADLARRLPLERKVAQLFLFGFEGTDAGAEIFGRLRRLDLGGVVLAAPNYIDPAQLGALAGELAATARARRHVPPLVLAIQEGGDLNSFPGLPPSAAPADLASAREARAQAVETGRTLRELGVNGVLGPVVDVGLESGSALGARVYSDQPDQVAGFAEASVRAYRRTRLFGAAAHFPGLGGADQSTEEGPATVGLDLPELRDRDLVPFAAAIDAGVPGITLSHALYPMSDFTVPASLSPEVVTRLLRNELGFEGVALTDDLADPSITRLSSVADAAVRALRAGADLLFVSGPTADQQAAYVAVVQAVRSGRVPRERLDEAVARILVAKKNYALIR